MVRVYSNPERIIVIKPPEMKPRSTRALIFNDYSAD